MYFIDKLEAAVLSIKERIEQASEPDDEAQDSAEIETEVLFQAVVAMDDTLPTEISEIIVIIIIIITSNVFEHKW